MHALLSHTQPMIPNWHMQLPSPSLQIPQGFGDQDEVIRPGGVRQLFAEPSWVLVLGGRGTGAGGTIGRGRNGHSEFLLPPLFDRGGTKHSQSNGISIVPWRPPTWRWIQSGSTTTRQLTWVTEKHATQRESLVWPKGLFQSCPSRVMANSSNLAMPLDDEAQWHHDQ